MLQHKIPFSLLSGFLVFFYQITYSDQTPLSQIGLGLKLNPVMPSQAAMGFTGMAKVNKQGAYLLNPSLGAFNTITSFEFSFKSTLNQLSDNHGTTRLTSSTLPFIALSHTLGSYGNLYLAYSNCFEKKFSYTQKEKNFRLESGPSEISTGYSYPFSPFFSIGLSYFRLFGSERQITEIKMPDSTHIPFEDTTLATYSGGYPSISATLRDPHWSLGIRLDIPSKFERLTSKHATNQTFPLDTTEEFSIPLIWAVGIAKKSHHHTYTLDFIWEHWDKNIDNHINEGFMLASGYERRALGSKFDPYYKRIHTRAGAGIRRHYIYEMFDYFASFGLGLPVGQKAHLFDIALVGGYRNPGENISLQDAYLQIHLGMTGLSVWGQSLRRK